MVAVRVAVLFVGLMRIADQTHRQSIITSTQGCDTYVVTYESELNCGAHFTQNNESRLLAIPSSTISNLTVFLKSNLTVFMKSSRISMKGAPSLNQWLLLDEGLKHFGKELKTYETIVRTRSDMITPPGFMYSYLKGTDNVCVVNARTDFMFYSSSKTFLDVFKDFFKTAKEKYVNSHFDPQESEKYLDEYVPKVVTCITSDGDIPVRSSRKTGTPTGEWPPLTQQQKSSVLQGKVPPVERKKRPQPIKQSTDKKTTNHHITQLVVPMSRSTMVVIPDRFKDSSEIKLVCGCQLGTDLHHPWRTMKSCGFPSVFCSESSFTYHIITKGASCQPIFGSPNPPAQPDYIFEQIWKSLPKLQLNENSTFNHFDLREEKEKEEEVHHGNKVKGRRHPPTHRGKKQHSSQNNNSENEDKLELHNNRTAVEELLSVLKSKIYVERWGEFKYAPTDFTLRSDRHVLTPQKILSACMDSQ